MQGDVLLVGGDAISLKAYLHLSTTRSARVVCVRGVKQSYGQQFELDHIVDESSSPDQPEASERVLPKERSWWVTLQVYRRCLTFTVKA